MYKQAGSAQSRVRHLAPGVLALLAVLAVALPASAQEQVELQELRGIFMNPGDTAKTAITPVGDIDTFVFDALADSEMQLEVRAIQESGLMPGLELLAPDGSTIDISARLVEKRKKAKIRRFVLSETGRYGFRVTGRSESVGDYKVKLAVTPPKKRTEKFSLSPLKLMNVRFGAEADTVVHATISSKGGPVYVVHVADPLGNEIPGAARLFKETDEGLQARLFPTNNSGNYYIGLRGNLDTTTNVTVRIRTMHTPPIAQKRTISKFEPIVHALDPDFGLVDNGIAIEGENFLPGTITVLFDDIEAPSAFYVNAGKINVIVPPKGEENQVSVTVYNQDGQSGTKDDAFIYVPPPPSITSLTPTVGPDDGNTLVTLTGESLSFVESVTMGQDPLTTKPTILDDNTLTFTTDAHEPGTVTITVTDKFDRSGFLSNGFHFAMVPVVDSLAPTAGTVKGGTILTVSGDGFRSDHEIYLGGTRVTTFTVLSPQEMAVVTPAHPLGSVDLRIVDPWSREVTYPDVFHYVSGTLIDMTYRVVANGSSSSVGGNSLAIGDINSGSIAGRVDIVLGAADSLDVGEPYTRVLENSGSAGWDLSSQRFDKFESKDVELGDLDGDGDLDLLVTQTEFETAGRIYYYNGKTRIGYWWYYEPYMPTRLFVNDGEGVFTEDPDALPGSTARDSDDPDVRNLLLADAISLGDVDGDKDLDIVLTSSTVAVAIYDEFTYDKTSWSWYVYYYDFYYYYDPSMTSTRLLTNDGTGEFHDVSEDQLPAVEADAFAGQDVIVADVDGDGDQDIVLTGDMSSLREAGYVFTAGSKTRVLVNDGDGYFTDGTSSLMPATIPEDDWGGLAVGVGDLDGDKNVEIVITTDRALSNAAGDRVSSTRVFEKGTGSAFVDATAKFMPAVNASGDGDTFRGVSIAVGDPDGNGTDEIFLLLDKEVFGQHPDTGAYTKQVSSLRWIARRTGLPLENVTAGQLPDPDETGDYYLGHRVEIGDLDGDGDLDLAITTTLSSYLQEGERPTRVFEFR